MTRNRSRQRFLNSRHVEHISDLQNRVKWAPRWIVGISDLILAVATVRCVFWVVDITIVNSPAHVKQVCPTGGLKTANSSDRHLMISPLWSRAISDSNDHSSLQDTHLASGTVMPLTMRVYGDSSYSQRKNLGIVGYGACAILYKRLSIQDSARTTYHHARKYRKDRA